MLYKCSYFDGSEKYLVSSLVILPPMSVFTSAIAAPNLSGMQQQGTKGKLMKIMYWCFKQHE
uniref:Uncharacterized protein n=1 Tax=Arundo donax TaxID=35708 RepID=A0A0A9A2Z9_ARUDO